MPETQTGVSKSVNFSWKRLKLLGNVFSKSKLECIEHWICWLIQNSSVMHKLMISNPQTSVSCSLQCTFCKLPPGLQPPPVFALMMQCVLNLSYIWFYLTAFILYKDISLLNFKANAEPFPLFTGIDYH